MAGEKTEMDIFDKIKYHSGLIFAVVFLMACQSGMLLVNKAVMIVWDLPITITLIQMAFTDLVIVSLFWWTLRVGSWADVRRWALWVPQLFAMMLATSMLALHYSSTGAVVVTRNIAPIVTLAIEAVMKEKVRLLFWPPLIAPRHPPHLLAPHTTSPPANAAHCPQTARRSPLTRGPSARSFTR